MMDSILQSTFDSWIQEIQRILQYYMNRKQGNRIDQVFLYGGCSTLKGIVNHFEIGLNIPTKKLTHLNNVQWQQGKSDILESHFLNVVGAMIRK